MPQVGANLTLNTFSQKREASIRGGVGERNSAHPVNNIHWRKIILIIILLDKKEGGIDIVHASVTYGSQLTLHNF